MSTEIIINDKYKLIDDGTQYELYVFDEGGREARNPATGKTIITQSKWKRSGLYFQTIGGACKRIARMEASSGGVVTIKDYIVRIESVEQAITESLKNR